MEEWRDVSGYENLYRVSSLGRVCRIKGYGCKKERLLTPRYDKDGYVLYKLYKNGGYKKIPAHRLVALSFIPNPSNFPEVNHKDGVRINNNVDNLEWCTSEYNIKYIYKDRYDGVFRDIFPISQFTLEGEKIRTFRNAKEASICTDIILYRIILCVEGKIHQAGGYIWKKDKEK